MPFALGRPLGVPGDADFQHRVLSAALALLPVTGDPVMTDYAEDAPESTDSEDTWVCPVSFTSASADTSPATQVINEMALLQPWYDKSRQAKPTSVGLSGLDMPANVMFIASFLDGGQMDSPLPADITPGDLLKHAAEDIKAFYNEAAASQPGTATIKAMEDWYWGETRAGQLIRQVKLATLDHPDPGVKLAAGFLLVPGSQAFRDA